ncbi:hypothetical protein ACIRST_38920 [Kitasatospora sp. NPDC101447]
MAPPDESVVPPRRPSAPVVHVYPRAGVMVRSADDLLAVEMG